MVSHLFFYQLALVVLVWLCVMLQWVWPSDPVAACSTTQEPPPPRRKRCREPKPFAGLTTKPPCDACAPASGPPPRRPCSPTPTHRHDARTPPSDRPRTPFLPQSGLSLPGLGGAGQYQCQGTSYHLSTPICQFFTPSARLAHDEFGWHHSRCDDAAWPQAYAAVGRQYCVKPGPGAAPSPATSYTRC